MDRGLARTRISPGTPQSPPPWDGRPLNGIPLILVHEQGLGDLIQFARFAPIAAARANSPVWLTTPEPARRLLSSLPGVDVTTPPPIGWPVLIL